jgi:hypothetical protein
MLRLSGNIAVNLYCSVPTIFKLLNHANYWLLVNRVKGRVKGRGFKKRKRQQKAIIGRHYPKLKHSSVTPSTQTGLGDLHSKIRSVNSESVRIYCVGIPKSLLQDTVIT